MKNNEEGEIECDGIAVHYAWFIDFDLPRLIYFIRPVPPSKFYFVGSEYLWEETYTDLREGNEAGRAHLMTSVGRFVREYRAHPIGKGEL